MVLEGSNDCGVFASVSGSLVADDERVTDIAHKSGLKQDLVSLQLATDGWWFG